MSSGKKFGIRIRPEDHTGAGGWKRGVQFRRDPDKPSGWRYWRNEWPTKKAAQLRLDRYRELGYVGHVFEIQQKPTYPNETHYSEHFTREELNCKGTNKTCGCNGKNPSPEIQRNLAWLAKTGLEPLRAELGGALGILSGYRCPVHNKAVGGASKSMHMQGKAADPYVPAGTQAKFDAAVKKVPSFANGGRGRYPNGGRHVDQGPKREW